MLILPKKITILMFELGQYLLFIIFAEQDFRGGLFISHVIIIDSNMNYNCKVDYSRTGKYWKNLGNILRRFLNIWALELIQICSLYYVFNFVCLKTFFMNRKQFVLTIPRKSVYISSESPSEPPTFSLNWSRSFQEITKYSFSSLTRLLI